MAAGRHARLRLVRRHAGGAVGHLHPPRDARARRRRLERGRPGLGRSRPVRAEPGDLRRSRRPARSASSTPRSPAGGRRNAWCASARSSRGADGVRSGAPRTLDLPQGSFVRAQVTLRDDGAWMLPLFLCRTVPGRALDRQPRRRRGGDQHRPRRDLGPRRGAGLDRLRPHDAGAARRRADRRLLPAPAGGLRLPHRERRRRPQLVGAGGDRRAEQQLVDRRDRARATGGSRCSATRSPRRSPRRGARRSTTSSARTTTAAAIPPAASRRSGACRGRR